MIDLPARSRSAQSGQDVVHFGIAFLAANTAALADHFGLGVVDDKPGWCCGRGVLPGAGFSRGRILFALLPAFALLGVRVLNRGDRGAHLQRGRVHLSEGNFLKEVQHVVRLDQRRRRLGRVVYLFPWPAGARTRATAASFDSSHLNSNLKRGNFLCVREQVVSNPGTPQTFTPPPSAVAPDACAQARQEALDARSRADQARVDQELAEVGHRVAQQRTTQLDEQARLAEATALAAQERAAQLEAQAQQANAALRESAGQLAEVQQALNQLPPELLNEVIAEVEQRRTALDAPDYGYDA